MVAEKLEYWESERTMEAEVSKLEFVGEYIGKPMFRWKTGEDGYERSYRASGWGIHAAAAASERAREAYDASD